MIISIRRRTWDKQTTWVFIYFRRAIHHPVLTTSRVSLQIIQWQKKNHNFIFKINEKSPGSCDCKPHFIDLLFAVKNSLTSYLNAYINWLRQYIPWHEVNFKPNVSIKSLILFSICILKCCNNEIEINLFYEIMLNVWNTLWNIVITYFLHCNETLVVGTNR